MQTMTSLRHQNRTTNEYICNQVLLHSKTMNTGIRDRDGNKYGKN